MKKLGIFMLLVIATMGAAAQTEDSSTDSNIRYGLRGLFSIESLNQERGNDYIFSNPNTAAFIGGFLEYRNWEANIETNFSSISGELGYKFHNNFVALAGGNYGLHNVEFSRDDGSYYSYYYSYGEMRVAQYYVGVGYHGAWDRLKFKLDAKIGSINSSHAEASDVERSYYYGDYYYGSSSSANKKTMITDYYKLSPTLMYGASAYLELLPRKSMKRESPIVPFFELSLMGSGQSTVNRARTVSEWVPENVIGSEDFKTKDYSLLYSQVRFGLKWYLKY